MTFNVGNPVLVNFTSNQGANPQERVFQDLSQGNPNQWYWNFGDGATATIQNPTHAYPAAGGAYNVRFAAFNNCGWDTTTSALNISGVGQDEFMLSHWTLSPNPANQRMVLSGPAGMTVDRVEVLDALGRVVYRGKLPADGALDVQAYSAGRYLVRLWSQGAARVLPFVKQ